MHDRSSPQRIASTLLPFIAIIAILAVDFSRCGNGGGGSGSGDRSSSSAIAPSRRRRVVS
jgi:hypothetical protein